MVVSYLGYGQMQQFMHIWDHVMCGMPSDSPVDILEVLILKQIRNSSVLKAEIARYDRCDPGHPGHTYKCLRRAVERYTDQQTRVENRKSAQQALAKTLGARLALAAPGPDEDQDCEVESYDDYKANEEEGDTQWGPLRCRPREANAGARPAPRARAKGAKNREFARDLAKPRTDALPCRQKHSLLFHV